MQMKRIKWNWYRKIMDGIPKEIALMAPRRKRKLRRGWNKFYETNWLTYHECVLHTRADAATFKFVRWLLCMYIVYNPKRIGKMLIHSFIFGIWNMDNIRLWRDTYCTQVGKVGAASQVSSHDNDFWFGLVERSQNKFFRQMCFISFAWC